MADPLSAVARGPVRQGTLPQGELDQLLAAMHQGEPWRQALDRLDLPILRRKRHWFTNEDKARFYLGLHVPDGARALDIGAGSGVISAGLVRGGYAAVVALEHDPRWSDFLEMRYAEDGLADRITVVNGSAVPRLPFKDATFDLVVVNGVLEWIPEAWPEISPGAAQLAFLREVHRVLRPEGALGIAIENRLALYNFRGDGPHGEPPYAVILPRWVANLYVKHSRGKPYSTWIYTARGYRALLRRAGFPAAEVHPVLPSYHVPERVVDLKDAWVVRREFVTRKWLPGVVLDLLARTGVLGHLCHSFYLVAVV